MMTFKETCEKLAKHVVEDGGRHVVGPGGCRFRTDPENPHLGGNLPGGDSGTVHADGDTLWPWLLEHYKLKSVLDVGCAEGHCVQFFKDNGIISVGLEGLKLNVDICKSKGLNVVHHDITSDVQFPSKIYDLVMCSDVAEHIAIEHIDKLINILLLGKNVAMVHGIEQHHNLGWHHVNNQSEAWWNERLKGHGLIVDEENTRLAKSICTGWFGTFGRIFVNTTLK
jgi:SAM-dependent methyltransferase